MCIIKYKFKKKINRKKHSKLGIIIVSIKLCLLDCLISQPVLKAISTRFDNILIYINKINHVDRTLNNSKNIHCYILIEKNVIFIRAR